MNISETVRDKTILTKELELEVICLLSNGVIFVLSDPQPHFQGHGTFRKRISQGHGILRRRISLKQCILHRKDK